MWLEAPVEEIDDRGRRHRTTRNKDEGRGSPQGSPLSPLLANIYMRRFIPGWKTLGHESRLDAHIVNYADDFVICCRGTADEAMQVMRSMMTKLRLTVNETKTRLCRVPEESVNFLGYTIGLCHSPRTGRSYIGTKPSAKKINSLKAEIHELTSRRWLWTTVEDRVAKLNRKLLGWSNYFCLGPVSPAYRAVDRHARHRLRQWLRGKHKVQSRGTTRFPDARLHDEFGLIRLSDCTFRDFVALQIAIFPEISRGPGISVSPPTHPAEGINPQHPRIPRRFRRSAITKLRKVQLSDRPRNFPWAKA